MDLISKVDLQQRLAERIQANRRLARMSQENLSRVAGTSLDNLKKIEQGRGMPKIPLLVNIANTLGCSTDDLLLQKEEVAEREKRITILQSIYLKFSPEGRIALTNIAEVLLSLEKNKKR